mmetsp:Transcript_2721/g.10615  ORF Transcript_2721/g.10615 Transcript_2721/m.10615 type:complete len:251 (+) Transcript_2721:643-1395(+)
MMKTRLSVPAALPLIERGILWRTSPRMRKALCPISVLLWLGRPLDCHLHLRLWKGLPLIGHSPWRLDRLGATSLPALRQRKQSPSCHLHLPRFQRQGQALGRTLARCHHGVPPQAPCSGRWHGTQPRTVPEALRQEVLRAGRQCSPTRPWVRNPPALWRRQFRVRQKQWNSNPALELKRTRRFPTRPLRPWPAPSSSCQPRRRPYSPPVPPSPQCRRKPRQLGALQRRCRQVVPGLLQCLRNRFPRRQPA